MRPLCAVILLSFALLGAPAPGAADGLAVRGLVADDAGRPLDATVELFALRGRYDEEFDLLAGEPRRPADALRTAADGRFVLAAPAPGLYEVVVSAPGRLALRTVLAPLVEDVELAPARPERAAPLSVRVEDDLGPVDGATVRLLRILSHQPLLDRTWTPASRQGTTGGDGTVVLSRGENEVTRLAVLTAEHPEGRTEGFRDLDEVTIELARGVLRTVAVRDPEARPVAGAVVRFGPDAVPMTWTDAAGRFTVPVPAEGNAVVSAETADGLAGWNVVELEPAEGQRVLLGPPRELVAWTFDGTTGFGLPGVWLALDDQLVTSDGDGLFTLAVPRRPRGAGELFETAGARTWGELRAARPGYLPLSAAVRKRGDELRVPNLDLRPAILLAGRVVDQAGAPVDGAGVSLVTRSRGRLRFARSAPDGRFHLPAADEGRYRLEVAKAGYLPAWTEAVARRGGTAVDVVLERKRRAFASVIDPAGRPIAGARVKLWTSEQERYPTTDPAPRHSATTGGDGVFEVFEAAPQSYLLRATAEGFAPFAVGGLEVTGETEVDLGTVVLDYGARIAGRVVDTGGYGVSRARIDFEPWASRGRLGPWELSGATGVYADDDGYFELTDRTPGEKLDLWAWRAGYAQASALGVVSPNEDVELVLRSALSVRGTVVDPGGWPVAGARVWAYYQGSDGAPFSLYATTDEAGGFELTQLEAGGLELEVRADGFPVHRQRLEVEDDAEYAEALLRLVAPAPPEARSPDGPEPELYEVFGYLRDTEGAPIAGLRVSLGARRAMSADDGSFLLRGVPSGRHRILVRDGDVTSSEYQVVVDAAPVTDLEIVLERRGVITGRVLGLEASELGDLWVTASRSSPEGRAWRWDRVGLDGRYRIEDVGSGEWTVEASNPSGERRVRDTVAVTPGVETLLDLEFVLPATGG